jgi:Protein of unknown function (DUF933)
MAEVMKVADLIEAENETAVKAQGKYRQQGRNYVVEDGDIINFETDEDFEFTIEQVEEEKWVLSNELELPDDEEKAYSSDG